MIPAATPEETRATLARAFRRELDRASSVLIGTHLNPDGDALGSALALSWTLDGLGIRNEVLCHHPPPRNLRWLPGVNRVRREPQDEKHDLGVILDLDAWDRLGDTGIHFAVCPRTVVVDHHVPHEAPGHLRIVDVSAPATAVLLARLFLDLGLTITPEVATCLLTGIVTDTGSFRFRNTTPEALSLAAMMLERGGDVVRISEEIFQSKPLAGQRLLGLVLERLRLAGNDRIAWSAVSALDFETTGARDEDTEGFVNELLSIEGVQVAAILREPRPGKVRCSLRSRGTWDVAAVARTFGGGGHKNAAGCTLEGSLGDAEAAVVAGLERCLASSS